MRVFQNLNIDFLAKRKIAYVVSTILLIIGIGSLVLRGLELGIDFKGGSEIALQFEEPVEITEVRDYLNTIGIGNVEVKTFGGASGILVRTEMQEIPEEVYPRVLEAIDREIAKYNPEAQYELVDTTINSVIYEFATPEITRSLTARMFRDGFQTSEFDQTADNRKMVVRVGIADWIEENLRERNEGNSFTVLKEEQVGPKVGQELQTDAIIAILLSLVVILIYLGFRFKFIFALGAVAALFHDVLITLGVFSLLYGVTSFLNLEITISIVAAFLTLVGYSINDTVVVFDRVRENLKIHKTAPIENNINKGINQTIPRTLITSLTTLMVVTVLLIFGGEVLRGFAFTLFFGILIGTYSSVFVASPIILEYSKKAKNKITF